MHCIKANACIYLQFVGDRYVDEDALENENRTFMQSVIGRFDKKRFLANKDKVGKARSELIDNLKDKFRAVQDKNALLKVCHSNYSYFFYLFVQSVESCECGFLSPTGKNMNTLASIFVFRAFFVYISKKEIKK